MKTDRLPIQINRAEGTWKRKLTHTEGRGPSIPREVGEAAWQGYYADGHGRSQDCKRLHERGGFGLSELGYYLARAVDEGRVEIKVVA